MGESSCSFFVKLERPSVGVVTPLRGAFLDTEEGIEHTASRGISYRQRLPDGAVNRGFVNMPRYVCGHVIVRVRRRENGRHHRQSQGNGQYQAYHPAYWAPCNKLSFMLHYFKISFLVFQYGFALCLFLESVTSFSLKFISFLSFFVLGICHLLFYVIHKNKNRLSLKSVSLLAPYFPSDQLRVIARCPILHVLEYQELIRKPPEKVNKYKLPNHLILRTTHVN